MKLPRSCPACAVALHRPLTPAERANPYWAGRTEAPLVWLIEIQGLYDGALLYRCPECKHQWPRFEPGHYLHQRAVDALALKPE